MSNDLAQPVDDGSSLTALPVTPQKKGQSVLAWIAIILLVGAVVVVRNIATAPEAPALEDRTDGLAIMKLQARYYVGLKDLLNMSGKELYAQIKAMNTGSVDQRLLFVVLAGELDGPIEAQAQLHQLGWKLSQAGKKTTPEQTALMDILLQLYEDYKWQRFNAPSVTKDQRERVRSELGWFGELALAPADDSDPAARQAVMRPARRTVLAILGFIVGWSILGILGFAGLIVFALFLFTGQLKSGIHCGLLHGGVYAETFAWWMALFMGLSVAAGKVATDETRWLLTAGAQFLSLLALLWPVLRGIPWRQVRWEIGLRLGKQPALEPVIGVAGYAMALPLLVVGIIVMVILLLIQGGLHGFGGTEESFDPVHLPSHPVVPFVVGGDWRIRLQILFLASVAAPIVEETMFRGVLYRHLREASAKLGFALSVLLSATLVSFIFAVIHPQGVVAVPPLMALAFAFALVREWRGTLLPAMVAHGISNGLVMILLMLVMGD